jgi:proliferating cell nuclear antigen
MEVVFVSNAALKRLVESIRELNTEVKFEFGPKSMEMQVMDSAHVSLIILHAHGDDDNLFAHYSVAPRTNFVLDVHLGSLALLLTLGDNLHQVKLTMTDPADESVLVSFRDPSTLFEKSNGILKLMSLEYDKLGIPETQSNATLTMPAIEYRMIMAKLQALGDEVDFIVSDDKARFVTNGSIKNSYIGDVGKTYTPGDDDGIKIERKEDEKDAVCQRFAMRYMCLFAKASAMSSTVKLSMTDEAPLTVNFPIGKPFAKATDTLPDQYLSYIRFYLAPKISDE